jgi:hypothetical protein
MIKLRHLEHRYLLIASYIPVRRATPADPMIPLNHNA